MRGARVRITRVASIAPASALCRLELSTVVTLHQTNLVVILVSVVSFAVVDVPDYQSCMVSTIPSESLTYKTHVAG